MACVNSFFKFHVQGNEIFFFFLFLLFVYSIYQNMGLKYYRTHIFLLVWLQPDYLLSIIRVKHPMNRENDSAINREPESNTTIDVTVMNHESDTVIMKVISDSGIMSLDIRGS